MTDNIKASTPDLSAWEMLTTILTGIYLAEDKARAEYNARVAEAGGKPFGRGVTPAAHILEAASAARKELESELRAIARANNFTMPDLK